MLHVVSAHGWGIFGMLGPEPSHDPIDGHEANLTAPGHFPLAQTLLVHQGHLPHGYLAPSLFHGQLSLEESGFDHLVTDAM